MCSAWDIVVPNCFVSDYKPTSSEMNEQNDVPIISNSCLISVVIYDHYLSHIYPIVHDYVQHISSKDNKKSSQSHIKDTLR